MGKNKDIISESKTVANMKQGQTAVISGFTDEFLSMKFLDMGLLPGTAIRFNYSAPFGDPICVNASGMDLSIRLSEAKTISIFD